MKKHLLLTNLFLCFCLAWSGQALAADQIPKGWFKAGSAPQHYEITKDTQTHTGKAGKSIKIRGLNNAEAGFTTLMQTIQAKQYLGSRVRFSAYIRSEGLAGWAGLWMRIDGKGDKTLGFDNMHNRKIQGTTGWKQYSVVLDIPPGSEYIAFGILSNGAGNVWIEGIRFEKVDKSVKTTNLKDTEQGKEAPSNLNFED